MGDDGCVAEAGVGFPQFAVVSDGHVADHVGLVGCVGEVLDREPGVAQCVRTDGDDATVVGSSVGDGVEVDRLDGAADQAADSTASFKVVATARIIGGGTARPRRSHRWA